MQFSPETLFQTVQGQAQGDKTKEPQGHQGPAVVPQKFKLDKSFIEKILEFETSSPLLRNTIMIYKCFKSSGLSFALPHGNILVG